MSPGYLLDPGDVLKDGDLRLFNHVEVPVDESSTVRHEFHSIQSGQAVPRVPGGGIVTANHPGHFFRPTKDLPNPEADLLKEKLAAKDLMAANLLKQIEALQTEVKIERARADTCQQFSDKLLSSGVFAGRPTVPLPPMQAEVIPEASPS